MMRWAMVSAALMLSGCVTLHDIDQQTPKYTGEAQGDYFLVAECLHSGQVSIGNTQATLARDRAHSKATVVLNSDAGPLGVYETRQIKADAVAVRYFSNLRTDQSLIDSQVKSCSGAKA